MLGKIERLIIPLVILAVFCSGCERRQPISTNSSSPEVKETELRGLSLFLELGPFEEYLEKSEYSSFGSGENVLRVYTYENDEVDFELNANLQGDITYLRCYHKKERPKTAPVEFKVFQDRIQAIRAFYGTENYRDRRERWKEYQPGDSVAVVEYTRSYDGVFHYEESMAFSIDMTLGMLRGYAWKCESPEETRVVLSPEEAVFTAEQWIAEGHFEKVAEEYILRPDALDRRSPDSTALEFRNGVKCYCVLYRLGNPYDLNRFFEKIPPMSPFPFAIWISAADGTVLDYGYRDSSYRPTAFPGL